MLSHQHAQPGSFGLDLLDEVHTALAWHRHVQQQHIALERAHALQDFVSVTGFAHHVDIAGSEQQLLEALAQDGVIIGNQHSNHGAASLGASGSRTSTCVPFPGHCVRSLRHRSGVRVRAPR